MVLKKQSKNIFLLCLMFCLVISSYGSAISTVFGAESEPLDSSFAVQTQFSDLEGHWAEPF
ncbi:putative membrane protein [Paenibacillus eucommiae]|uniref:Membrane protein n=1 Tax=Paenibacillus eucommiae TaxID=1355755 RepID=A0ABS4IYS9_9BACL|nr:putative membrane protein [Paenibacillus eucommiae]